ncbi:MAG: GGDEF domain-containing protein [Lachnospiraceae bacterium]|nr:GGDEF domain-containing protein [Lachnospiraceae bacterium]
MGYQSIPYDKRVKENIRNYSFSNLYHMDTVKEYLKNLAKAVEISILLTDRHGEKEILIGDGFVGFRPDVVNEPGRKVRVQNRTIGHLYVKETKPQEDDCLVRALMDGTVKLLERLGEETYLRHESSIYLEELEVLLKEKRRQVIQNETDDALTGVYNKMYFESRMDVIDRAEIIPVAVLNVNINDWKYANDHFGDEESDRLIKTVADILKKEAKPDFILGRIDGDAFGVLIPMATEGEAEDYIKRIQEACDTYEDPHLAPSVAVGMVVKTNIEEKLEERMSDAEYEMFNNKFEVKNAPGYQERLHKGM